MGMVWLQLRNLQVPQPCRYVREGPQRCGESLRAVQQQTTINCNYKDWINQVAKFFSPYILAFYGLHHIITHTQEFAAFVPQSRSTHHHQRYYLKNTNNNLYIESTTVGRNETYGRDRLTTTTTTTVWTIRDVFKKDKLKTCGTRQQFCSIFCTFITDRQKMAGPEADTFFVYSTLPTLSYSLFTYYLLLLLLLNVTKLNQRLTQWTSSRGRWRRKMLERVAFHFRMNVTLKKFYAYTTPRARRCHDLTLTYSEY